MRLRALAATCLLCIVHSTSSSSWAHDWDAPASAWWGYGAMNDGAFTDPQVAFIASTYRVVTLSTCLQPGDNASVANTIMGVAARLKALSPSIKVLQYWNMQQWAATTGASPTMLSWSIQNWWLLDDSGKPVYNNGSPQYDWQNPRAVQHWLTMPVAVNGTTLLDGFLLDGAAVYDPEANVNPSLHRGPEARKVGGCGAHAAAAHCAQWRARHRERYLQEGLSIPSSTTRSIWACSRSLAASRTSAATPAVRVRRRRDGRLQQDARGPQPRGRGAGRPGHRERDQGRRVSHYCQRTLGCYCFHCAHPAHAPFCACRQNYWAWAHRGLLEQWRQHERLAALRPARPATRPPTAPGSRVVQGWLALLNKWFPFNLASLLAVAGPSSYFTQAVWVRLLPGVPAVPRGPRHVLHAPAAHPEMQTRGAPTGASPAAPAPDRWVRYFEHAVVTLDLGRPAWAGDVHRVDLTGT